MNKKNKEVTLGRLFIKPDIERCDLFIDSGFLDWGVYTGKVSQLNEDSKKGIQMYSSVPSGGHKKCGLQSQSGYFDKVFSTIFVDDPYIEKWKLMRRPPANPRKGAWIPSGPAKHHSTPGDHYGTFTKASEMAAFSPLTKAKKTKKKELINFLTNPGKKGNSGYLDICINKYPPHSIGDITDSYVNPNLIYSLNWKKHKAKIRDGPLKAGFYPQPYFDSNPYKTDKNETTYVKPKETAYELKRGIFYPPAAPKKMGNNHDGCFSKFTEWSEDPYKTQRDVEKELLKLKGSNLVGVFQPQPILKTYYTVSVVNNKIDISCNERTWRTMKPITYPQFNL